MTVSEEEGEFDYGRVYSGASARRRGHPGTGAADGVGNHDLTEETAFIVTPVGRYDSLADYTRDSDMLHPLTAPGVDRTTGDPADLTDPIYFWFNNRCSTVSNDMPYILNSVWRSASGNSVTVVLANWDDRPHDILWEINGADHGLDTSSAYTIQEFGGSGSTQQDIFVGDVHQQVDTLPKFSVKTYRICLVGSPCD